MCEGLNTFGEILITLVLLRLQQLGNKYQWSLCVPLGVTVKNFTFCPHSVFMCFVWI